MNCDKKRMERAVLASALASFIFVCGALLHEGIQIVVQEQNRPSEATAGRVEATLTVSETGDGRGRAKTDIHNSASAKETDTAGNDKRQTDARTDTANGDERQAVRRGAERGRQGVCMRLGKIVRGFGWQEEDGVWRYHTGIDVAVEGGSDVCAIAGGTVHRVERCAGGYLIEVAAEDKLWRYEPLEEAAVTVGDGVHIGGRLGRTAADTDRLHIACRRGSVWLDPQTAAKCKS